MLLDYLLYKLHIPLLCLPGSPIWPVSWSTLFCLPSHYSPTILTQASFIA